VPSNLNRVFPRSLQTLFHLGSLTGITDGQLVERFVLRDGEASESAFAALVERHGPLVWSTCRAVLRDDHATADAFQATFLVLVRKAGSLWVRDSIGPWLHRVALRAAIQAKRETNRRQQAEQTAAALSAEWIDCGMPDDSADVIHHEIDRLSERYRVVIVLCDIEERSLEEAARHLRCPVGTVKSRLARARQRLRDALQRRGVAPAAIPTAVFRNASVSLSSLPQGLAPSTVRSALLFATDPIKAAHGVSNMTYTSAEGVLKVMILAKLYRATLGIAAASGLLVLAWLAHQHQAIAERPQVEAPVADQKTASRTVDLEGNWIVRCYPPGQAFGLIKIEGSAQRAHATLLSIMMHDFYRHAQSKVDGLRIDEKTVRFTLQLQGSRPTQTGTFNVIAYLPMEEANPKALWGSMEVQKGLVYPAKMERTDRTELDAKEDLESAPENVDRKRLIQAKDPAKRMEIGERMLKNYKDTPVAPLAAWVLAITQAEAKAPETEVRVLIDQAARLAARYGPEMEISAINVIVWNLVGMAEREDLILEYARKAVAKLSPSDSVALQTSTLKNLSSALRRARKIDESKAIAEADILVDRIAKLGASGGDASVRADQVKPNVKRDHVPWARNFAAARKEAKATGKLIMVDFYTETCGWCKRLDSDVFPQPAVGEAMRPFVPVKVDAEDGEGRPLAVQYQAHISGYPAIIFLDPAIEDPRDSRIVGKVPGFMPAGCFVEQLDTIARLPRDVKKLEEHHNAHPEDMDALRQLVTALTMQSRTKEATELADRAKDAHSDPDLDRWAAVYNTLGDECMLRLRPNEAARWFTRAAHVAKRPIDIYSAILGAGFVAALERKGEIFAQELEAAARVPGVANSEREFAKELLGMLVKPLAGSATVGEAAAALKRLDGGGSQTPGEQSHSAEKGETSKPN
jgi:RNA polymerase sigma factor (sigma-70 family)